MKKASNRFMKKRPLQFGDYSTRELWVASFAGVRGAITPPVCCRYRCC